MITDTCPVPSTLLHEWLPSHFWILLESKVFHLESKVYRHEFKVFRLESKVFRLEFKAFLCFEASSNLTELFAHRDIHETVREQ